MSVTISTTDLRDEAAPAVNMSNANARVVLEALGIVGDDVYCGTLSADDILGRVLMAEAMLPEDLGIPTYTTGADGRWVECGRPEGYTEARLAIIRDVAEYAQRTGHDVTWS